MTVAMLMLPRGNQQIIEIPRGRRQAAAPLCTRNDVIHQNLHHICNKSRCNGGLECSGYYQFRQACEGRLPSFAILVSARGEAFVVMLLILNSRSLWLSRGRCQEGRGQRSCPPTSPAHYYSCRGRTNLMRAKHRRAEKSDPMRVAGLFAYLFRRDDYPFRRGSIQDSAPSLPASALSRYSNRREDLPVSVWVSMASTVRYV